MATDVTRISEKVRKEPGLVFTTLYHHISDVDNLRACDDTLKAGKSMGVDGVVREEPEENLQDLSARLKRMGYHPGPKRRIYIPKPGSAKGMETRLDWSPTTPSITRAVMFHRAPSLPLQQDCVLHLYHLLPNVCLTLGCGEQPRVQAGVVCRAWPGCLPVRSASVQNR